MPDETEIKALLDRFEQSIYEKDAAGAIGCYTRDAVSFELAPPLLIGANAMHDPANLRAWFNTWDGPISSVADNVTMRVGGDVAYAFGLRHMTGTKADGTAVNLWFRSTAVLRKENGTWKIAHVHNSVPYAMDGSDKALLDLKPA